MILAIYIAAAVIMAVGSLYFAWRSRNFRKFLAGAFFVSSAFYSISISPMFRCLCWGRVLSKRPRSVLAAPSFISFSRFLLSRCNNDTIIEHKLKQLIVDTLKKTKEYF